MYATHTFFHHHRIVLFPFNIMCLHLFISFVIFISHSRYISNTPVAMCFVIFYCVTSVTVNGERKQYMFLGKKNSFCSFLLWKFHPGQYCRLHLWEKRILVANETFSNILQFLCVFIMHTQECLIVTNVFWHCLIIDLLMERKKNDLQESRVEL